MKELKCDICEKIFKEVEGLTMHNLAKHPELVPKEKNPFLSKRTRNWSIFILIVALAVWGIYTLVGSQEKYDAFAQCLKEKDAVMYAAYWCPACLEQKRILGNSKEIPYIECSLPNRGGQNQVCNEAEIESYPTWEFSDGTRAVGVLSRSELEEKTGCVFDDGS